MKTFEHNFKPFTHLFFYGEKPWQLFNIPLENAPLFLEQRPSARLVAAHRNDGKKPTPAKAWYHPWNGSEHPIARIGVGAYGPSIIAAWRKA